MEGYCRGCLISSDEPMELLQYTEKNRRLYVYSTGIQVKRNDVITFQLCKDCFANMKAACSFKKLCRVSDKKLKSYCSLKEAGVSIDFSTFLKNHDDSTLFRLPLVSGNSTPANYNKTRDEDNESTCTSIRNFMKDMLQGEEMADTEARIIREVIEEEADLLDDTLDSHWLHDENSIDNDFPLDLNFSPFATPNSVYNDHCYTPKREDQSQVKKYFTSISPIKHYRTMNVITDLIKNNQSEKEICSSNQNESDNEQATSNLDIYAFDKHKSTLDSNKDGEEILDFNLPIIEEEKSMLDISIDSENLINNLNLPTIDSEIDPNNAELQSFDSLPSIPSIQNESISNLDLPIMDNTNKNVNSANFYVNNDCTDYINTCKEIEKIVNDKLSFKNNVKEKPCTIDKNLARALKDENAREYSLDELLVSPQVCSAASTPTINNILFGEKLSSGKSLINKGSPKVYVQDFETDDFLQNDTKEFKAETENLKKEESKDVDQGDIVMKEVKETDNTSVYDQSQFDLENCFCNICQKKYRSVRALCVHSTKMHSIKIIKPNDTSYVRRPIYVSRPTICQYCGQEFRNLANYHRHIQRHKKAPEPNQVFKCNHCLLEFTSIYTLKHHKESLNPKSVKKDPGKFVCTVCGATSSTIGNFRLHQRRHTKEYKCQCPECGKKCYTQSELTVHIRIHTGEKPFPCSHCGKKFARKDSLVKHVKLHLDERPFACEYCKERFTTSTQLKVHVRLSLKCKKKRGIIIDTESPEVFDKNEVEENNVETETIIEMTEMETQLPYIDTEMSN